MKIPTQSKQFSQTNLSDVSGNIWYTKNMNFDEHGYAKLSSRAVSIFSIDEDSDFGAPVSLGRSSTTGGVYIAPGDNSSHPFTASLSGAALSISDDGTGATIPLGSLNDRGVWWQNKWHVTTQTGLKANTSGTWATAIADGAFTTAYPHPLEVFKSRTTLCVGNNNVVKQYTTAYSASTADLTLPSDYSVIALAYSGDLMGIATQMSLALSGQSGEALFFTWNGLQSDANNGYPVGSDAIIALKAYKSSWVLLTRNGKLLYFNGGGFETLATLPFFFKRYTVDITSMFGDIMVVQGDLIYLNIPADINYFGVKQEKYLQNFVGGILCYDPKVGLYHRYSPSISKLTVIQVSSVDTATDILNSTGTIPVTGNPIMYTNNPASLIGGLVAGTVYYVIRHSSTAFSLATTSANAIAGTKIDLTSSTSGTFFGLTITDYGSSRAIATNAVTTMGNQDFFYDHLMFGGSYEDTSLNTKQNLCLTVPQFSNRGYLVTPKLESQAIEDILQNFYIKYRPLKTQDSIIVKYKNIDVIGVPTTTPQRSLKCTWTSSTVLTTTANLSEIYTYLATSGNEAECEITSGAGAGQMPQISSISLSGSTYTINLSEAVDGVANGNLCNVIIDTWKLFETITSSDTKNWMQVPIAKSSKWHKFKVELRGVETTIEELQIINKPQLPTI